MFESKESQQDLFQTVTKTVTITIAEYDTLVRCHQFTKTLAIARYSDNIIPFIKQAINILEK